MFGLMHLSGMGLPYYNKKIHLFKNTQISINHGMLYKGMGEVVEES